MPSCVFRRCTNYDAKVNKTQGISYHMFPTNPFNLHEWIQAVREQRREYDWKPSKSSRVCSKHFKSEHKYVSSQGRMLLRKDAIPVVEKYEGYHIPVIFPDSYNNTTYLKSDPTEVEEIVVVPTIDLPRLHINNINGKERKRSRKKKKRIQEKKKSKKKFASLAIILKILKNRNYISQEQFTELNLKTKVMDLLNIMHRTKKTKKSQRTRYPLFFKKFVLKLHFFSSAAYDYVRKKFYTAFPHPKVLVIWNQNISGTPGFTKQAFDLLKKKCSASGKRILCNLVADKIPIRHNEMWTGKISDGLVDFGIESTNRSEIATHVYIFILVALNESWKIPVGYFFVRNMPADTRAYLIRTCISKCSYSGAEVVAVTFDGGPTNLATANLLGCNLNIPKKLKSTFNHPDCRKEVAIFIDPSHLLKLVRNTLQSKKIILNANNREVKWQLIVALNKLLSNQELKTPKKLSQEYIKFRNELMRIKLSTELFSKNISRVLKSCSSLKLSSKIKEIEATSEFIVIFNNLFDILNSRPSERVGFTQPISPQNFKVILKYLDKVKQYILSLCINNKMKRLYRNRTIINLTKKPIVECKSKAGFLGFLIGIQSLKYIYISHIIGGISFVPFIATYNLTLSNNEIFFDLSRSKCDSKRNLNAVQFIDVYRKVFNLLQLLPSNGSNCISLEHIPILPFSLSGVENINFSSGIRALENDREAFVATQADKIIFYNVHILNEILNNKHCVETVKLIIGYMSSWIARKLINIVKCETCVDALYTDQKMWYHKLISIRHIDGLCLSSENVFSVCLKSERFIKHFLKDTKMYLAWNTKKLKVCIMKSFIGTNIFESLNVHSRQQVPAYNHRTHLIQSIIDEFINIRISLAHEVVSALGKISTHTQIRRKLCLLE